MLVPTLDVAIEENKEQKHFLLEEQGSQRGDAEECPQAQTPGVTVCMFSAPWKRPPK